MLLLLCLFLPYFPRWPSCYWTLREPLTTSPQSKIAPPYLPSALWSPLCRCVLTRIHVRVVYNIICVACSTSMWVWDTLVPHDYNRNMQQDCMYCMWFLNFFLSLSLSLSLPLFCIAGVQFILSDSGEWPATLTCELVCVLFTYDWTLSGRNLCLNSLKCVLCTPVDLLYTYILPQYRYYYTLYRRSWIFCAKSILFRKISLYLIFVAALPYPLV